MASNRWSAQYLGAAIAKWELSLAVLIALTASVLLLCNGQRILFELIFCLSLLLQFILMCAISNKLMPVFSLRKQETRITWSQILVLVSFGLFIVSIVLLIDVNSVEKKTSDYMSITIIGAIMGWVFQDTIKSVVAFFYLRANGLVHIGDWIELKSHNVDGMLKMITLTTVTVENWDTTTSAFPTYLLHSQHFQNYQRMLDGKTHGRRMMTSFIIDTGWIHTLKEEDVIRTKERLEEAGQTDLANMDEIKVGTLNIELYRKYLYHWLMRQPKVTHEPRLLVRWQEQTNEGMPLQLYAFITETSLAPFEWQQSQIIEHTIKSLEWFDLQLYQSPSGYDASNSNVYLTPKEATYRKEEQA